MSPYKRGMPFSELELRRKATGALIKLWRLVRNDISQEKLEELAGLTKGRVTSYETGKDLPDAQNLERLAAAFQVEPKHLRYGTELLLHHLFAALDPREVDSEYPLPRPEDGEVAEPDMPDELRLAWEVQLKAEARLARSRQRLEYASYHQPPQGGPPTDEV